MLAKNGRKASVGGEGEIIALPINCSIEDEIVSLIAEIEVKIDVVK